MGKPEICVGGDGGPLVVLQAAAVPLWQGANDFENSLMNGGDIETDYDVICDMAGDDVETDNNVIGDTTGSDSVRVISRHGREMLVLWDSEFSATRLSSESVLLAPDAIVLTMGYHPDDLPDILPRIAECLRANQPQSSLPFLVQDDKLRLQVGADSAEPSYIYNYLDIPITPGKKRCELYLLEHESLTDDVVVIRDDLAQ